MVTLVHFHTKRFFDTTEIKCGYGCLRQAAGWGWLQGLTATPAIVQLGETGPSNMAVCQAWLLLLHVC